MAQDDKIAERKVLLKQAYARHRLFEIGKNLSVEYFERFGDAWDLDEDQAAFEIASLIDDDQLKLIFETYKPRDWIVFRGRYHTFEGGALSFEGSWETIQNSLNHVKQAHGKTGLEVLNIFLENEKGCSLKDVAARLKLAVDVASIVNELERLKIISVSYQGQGYKEWKIPEEVSPLVQSELAKSTQVAVSKSFSAKIGEVDYVSLERQEVAKMDKVLHDYLANLLKNRMEGTIQFGRTFSVAVLAEYLRRLFGPVLYFDNLLSITQQYGLADVEIIHEHGKTGMRTGWNLSLFGEPGTGKSFATRDMILGRPEAKVFPHGIPGRNRYAGGITPARFIRIGQAYANRVFNFVVPEFNDWFRYKGMVEPLKLAMERGEIRYETHREVIGPYRFHNFFSVNYNVAMFGRGYEVTVQDPNFNAIEDRMLCRLHRLTKERFLEIAQSQRRLAFGEIDIEEGAKQIRDHLTLVYAIETEHSLVRARFAPKSVLITPKAYEMIEKARNAILEQIPKGTVTFSARLEDRAIRFACAASLLNYFQSSLEYIPLSEDALKHSIQLYVEEASVRSRQEFNPEEVLAKIF